MRVGLVDDDPSVLSMLREQLSVNSLEITTDSETAADWLRQDVVDLLVTDLKMGSMSGIDLVEIAADRAPHIEVIIMTGHGSIETAVKAMKLGARDYLQKPIRVDQLQVVIDRAEKELEQRTQLEGFRAIQQMPAGYDSLIVGDSPEIESLRSMIEKVSSENVNVLIRGETGTGKELVAREIHRRSPRSHAPFIPINCAAIPAELLESELFGHQKGAFTGASETHRGKIELADGGTLFLDEIGEMPVELQPKLLRVLEQNQITRVGGESSRTVDVRFLSATNQNLPERLEQGAFRKDLFYRLQTIEIETPPLRDHPEDIPDLIEYFLKDLEGQSASVKTTYPESVVDIFKQYDWPGNVRELRNVVERLAVLSDDETITESQLPGEIREPSGTTQTTPGGFAWEPYGDDLETILESIEAEILKQTLKEAGGNKAEAARRLGISRQNLHYKLERNSAVSNDEGEA